MPPNLNRQNPFYNFSNNRQTSYRPNGLFGNQMMPHNSRVAQGGRGPGGLIAKLLNRTPNKPGMGHGPGFFGGFGPGYKTGIGGHQTGNVAGGPTGLGKATNLLGNVQQAINLVQQAAPLIQQYGPMVKNIPTIIQMWKLLSTASDEEAVEDRDKEEDDLDQQESNHDSSNESFTEDIGETNELEDFLLESEVKELNETVKSKNRGPVRSRKSGRHPKSRAGQSIPKLFI